MVSPIVQAAGFPVTLPLSAASAIGNKYIPPSDKPLPGFENESPVSPLREKLGQLGQALGGAVMTGMPSTREPIPEVLPPDITSQVLPQKQLTGEVSPTEAPPYVPPTRGLALPPTRQEIEANARPTIGPIINSPTIGNVPQGTVPEVLEPSSKNLQEVDSKIFTPSPEKQLSVALPTAAHKYLVVEWQFLKNLYLILLLFLKNQYFLM